MQFSRVIVSRLHIIGGDLQQSAQIPVEQTYNSQHQQPGRAQLDRPPKMTPGGLRRLPTAERTAAREAPMPTEGLRTGAGKTAPVPDQPPKQRRRKLSKAELREQAEAAFLAWREGQKAKDK